LQLNKTPSDNTEMQACDDHVKFRIMNSSESIFYIPADHASAGTTITPS